MEQTTMHGGSGYWGLFRNPWDLSFCSALFPHTLKLSLPTSTVFSRSQCPSAQGGVFTGQGKTGRKPSQMMLCHCSQVPVSDVRGLWSRVSAHPPALATRQWSDLQGLLQFPGSFLQSWSSPPSFAAPRFPHLNAEGNARSAPNWWFCLTSCY